METVSVKFQEKVLKEIDKTISKHNYNSRTEFIREAVRDKIKEKRIEIALQLLKENFGKGAHHNTTDEKLEKIREKVGKEIIKRYDLE